MHVALLVVHLPRTQCVMGSNPTQGSHFFTENTDCSVSISLPCLFLMYMGIQVSYYIFFPVLIMCAMCIVCLSFLPTSALASVFPFSA